MTMIDAATYYGLPSLPTTQPAPTAGPADTSGDNRQAVGPSRTGLFQDPVLILIGFLLLAFLLARAAEHGISLGFRIRA